jgi:hypothetical protein
MSADATVHLALAFLAEGQQHKEVTVNDALNRLDAVVQLAVLDRDLAAPPASPAEGDRYLVASGASGAWGGADGKIAAFFDGAWTVFAPAAGWLCWIDDEKLLLVHDGSAWQEFGGGPGEALQNLAMLGVGTTADATNPLAAKLNNALWTAKTVAEGGSGDLRYVFNKEGSANTGTMLFQTGFAGRAEIGLAGDDDLHLKVSPDGSAWTDALVVDRTSGVSKVRGLADAATGKPIASLLFTSGGDGQVSIWRCDAARGSDPRAATIAAVAGDTITLTAAVAAQFFHGFMAGVSYVRIWNTTKAAPGAPAWVKAAPAGNQLQVTDAAAIAGWVAGETVQIGDPSPAVLPQPAIALDVSPMLQAQFGAVFPQAGLMMKTAAIGSGVSVGFAASETAQGGSFSGINAMPDGAANGGLVIVPTSIRSPVSGSNLVFVHETGSGGTLLTTLASVIGVYV